MSFYKLSLAGSSVTPLTSPFSYILAGEKEWERRTARAVGLGLHGPHLISSTVFPPGKTEEELKAWLEPGWPCSEYVCFCSWPWGGRLTFPRVSFLHCKVWVVVVGERRLLKGLPWRWAVYKKSVRPCMSSNSCLLNGNQTAQKHLLGRRLYHVYRNRSSGSRGEETCLQRQVLCSKPAASQRGALFPEKPDTLCRLVVPGARTVSDFMNGDWIGSGILQQGLTLPGTGRGKSDSLPPRPGEHLSLCPISHRWTRLSSFIITPEAEKR